MKYYRSRTKVKKSVISRLIGERELGEFTYWGNTPILKLDTNDLFDLDGLCDITYYADKMISFIWGGVKFPVEDAPTEHNIFYINLKNRRVYTNYHKVMGAAEALGKLA